MLNALRKAGEFILTVISGILMRLLVFLTLACAVGCCVLFIYAVVMHDTLYCIASLAGAVVFTYVNKQT